MNNRFAIDFRAVQRVVYTMLAALLVIAGSPLFMPGRAGATQISNRSIQMSDSGPSGGTITTGVGSGTNVTYRVSFTTAAAASSLVIDFCTEDPILSDTCTRPSPNSGGGTHAVHPTGVSNVSGTVGNAGWALTAADGQAKLARTGGTSADDIAGTTPQVFDLTGILNPSTTGTFFARIYTYSNASFGTYSSPTSLGNYVDYGGVALSTAATITITARVQESLTFCVSAAAPSTWVTQHDCTDSVVASNPPSLILGHGTPTAVLTDAQVDRGSVYTQLSTNATHGAVINLRNSNTSCGGLSADGGTTCAIPAVNSGLGTSAPITAGTAAFGLSVLPSSTGTNGVGTVTPDSNYYDSGHVNALTGDLYYGMNTTNSTAVHASIPAEYDGAVTGTFGSTIATTAAPLYRVENQYVFGATASLTTPAGIYTANLSMIASGTF